MKTPAVLIEALYERVEDYGTLSIELAKLKGVETISKVSTALIARLSVFVTIILFIVILTIGIALVIGDMLGKWYYGFFIVASFYLVLAIVLHFFLHGWIKRPVSSMVISEILQ